MLLVGKQVWFGRAILSAYVLLVCFGHALHALPGHQHGCDACACSNAADHGSEATCAVDCSASACSIGDSCEKVANSSHDSVSDCPYGHSTSLVDVCSSVQMSGEQSGQKSSVPSVRNVIKIGVCSLCELLTSPQFAILVTEVDTAVVPLFVTVAASYLFPAGPVPSLHLARGPPSFFA
jgi:hypothetical protein